MKEQPSQPTPQVPPRPLMVTVQDTPLPELLDLVIDGMDLNTAKSINLAVPVVLTPGTEAGAHEIMPGTRCRVRIKNGMLVVAQAHAPIPGEHDRVTLAALPLSAIRTIVFPRLEVFGASLDETGKRVPAGFKTWQPKPLKGKP